MKFATPTRFGQKFSRVLMVAALPFALSLSACGFSPVHAQKGQLGATPNYANLGFGLEDITVNVTTDGQVNNEKIGYLLKQALRDRMGDGDHAAYVLSVEPKISRSGLGISGDDVASRYDLSLRSKFTLTESKTGTVILKDSVTTVSTYGASRDPYGAVSAQNTASEHVAQLAADRILRRMALKAKSK